MSISRSFFCVVLPCLFVFSLAPSVWASDGVDSVDTTPPTVTDDYKYPGMWSTEKETIHLTAHDAESGIKYIRYCWGERCSTDMGIRYLESGIKIRKERGEVLKYQATDNAGNVSEVHEIMVGVDLTDPYCGVWSPSIMRWTNEPVEFTLIDSEDYMSGVVEQNKTCIAHNHGDRCTVTIMDNSGRTSVCTTPQIRKDTTPPTCGRWIPGAKNWEEDTQVFQLTGSTDTQSGMNVSRGKCVTETIGGTCTIEISDTVGNVTVCESPKGNDDTTPPTVKDNYRYDNVWIGRSQKIKLSARDSESGIASFLYCWGAQCDPQEGEPYTELILVEETRDDVLRYQAQDVAGNFSAIGSVAVKIDKTGPLCGEWQPSDLPWTSGLQIFRLQNSTDNESGIRSAELMCIATQHGQTCSRFIQDNARNKTICRSPKAQIDRQAPDVQDDYTLDGKVATTAQTITLSADDHNESGVKNIRYCWGARCTPDVVYTQPIVIDENIKNILRYDAVDTVGNVSPVQRLRVHIEREKNIK